MAERGFWFETPAALSGYVRPGWMSHLLLGRRRSGAPAGGHEPRGGHGAPRVQRLGVGPAARVRVPVWDVRGGAPHGRRLPPR